MIRVDDQIAQTEAPPPPEDAVSEIAADDIVADEPIVPPDEGAMTVLDDEVPPAYDAMEETSFIAEGEGEDFVEAGAAEDDGPETKERPLAWLIHGAASPQYSVFMDLAGEPMQAGRGGLGLAIDVMTNELESGARLYFGGHFHGYKNAIFTGLRLGAAGDISDSLFLKLGANIDYIDIGGTDSASPYVPIELNDPPTTADGTAYSFSPASMGMSMRGMALTISPELAYMFKRWDIGGGKALGLGAFIGLDAGLYVGAVSDDGCSYAYSPESEGLEVRPEGGSYSFTQDGELGSRCRQNETSFGTLFVARAGLILEFSL